MSAERDELHALVRGLRAEIRRKAWLGAPRPARRASAPARKSGGAQARAAGDAQVPETGGGPAREAHAPVREAAQRPESTAGTPARSAADVREQAAACADLRSLARAVARCEACELYKTRTQTVFMDGQGTSGLLFVGEAPGADEDRKGVPFVGRAGGLLTDIITKGMGLARDDVHIANVLKCRPPGNRDPSATEKQTCTPWLERQIELTGPKVIVPLGKHAANYLLGLPPETPMGSTRGRVHVRAGRTLVPTFHPAYLLRNPSDKGECWKDIQVAMGVLGIEPPTRRPPPAAGAAAAPA